MQLSMNSSAAIQLSMNSLVAMQLSMNSLVAIQLLNDKSITKSASKIKMEMSIIRHLRFHMKTYVYV